MVIHVAAGVSGLVLTFWLGLVYPSKKITAAPHNVPFVLIGTALLWFGAWGGGGGGGLSSHQP